jgi:phage repressor protein C with HTH and peptisase S24 domain
MEGPILDRSRLNPDGTLKSEDPGAGTRASDIRGAWAAPEPHRPVPLIGTAFGGEWDADIEMSELRLSEVLDYVGRPPELQTDPDSYALEIVGESMAPRFEPGERAFVSPLSPVRIGDDVVVQLRASGPAQSDRVKLALIKRLTRRSPTFLELRQFNPDRTFQVPVEQVTAVHRVRGRF